MKTLLLIPLIFLLSACDQKTAEQPLPESQVVAMVGEEAITTDFLKAYLLAHRITNTDGETLNKALEFLIEEVAIANIAKKKKLLLSAEQLNTIKYLKLKAIADAAKIDHLTNNKVTEDEILKEYNTVNEQAGTLQYHVHHVMYVDEVEAIKNLEKINSVEDFLMFEKVFTQENSNMKGVGDLGWVSLLQLPKSFRGVVQTLEAGTVLKTVLNSEFGAHIVYLEETRALNIPKLEDVKAGIVKSLNAKKLSKFAQLAKAKARVVIKE